MPTACCLSRSNYTLFEGLHNFLIFSPYSQHASVSNDLLRDFQNICETCKNILTVVQHYFSFVVGKNDCSELLTESYETENVLLVQV